MLMRPKISTLWKEMVVRLTRFYLRHWGAPSKVV
jgi:hypothetical protein